MSSEEKKKKKKKEILIVNLIRSIRNIVLPNPIFDELRPVEFSFRWYEHNSRNENNTIGI